MNLVPFTNKKMKKLVNVYQLDYNNGKSSGIGDFLRGSFCFMQIANLLNLDFDIDITNHPLAKYVENNVHTEGLDYNNIEKYWEYNRDKTGTSNYEDKITNINPDFLNNTINWLNSKDSEVFGFFSNAFPSFNIHNDEGKNKILNKLKPNELMRNYIDHTLSKLQLSKKYYGVIHIRTGDKYLVNGETMKISFINKIKRILNTFVVKDRRYLIISDSNILKSYLKDIPNFFLIIKNIEHLGGEEMKNDKSNGVMNTMLDFYLMSYSNAIVSLSVYDHVSGFSKYCSVINNIPFKYIKINE